MREIPVRRASFTWFPTVGMVVFWLLFSLLIAFQGGDDSWFLALVGSGMMTLLWALGWGNSVRYTARYLAMTNGLVTTRVDWLDVAEVSSADGLSIVLRDGARLTSIQYGSSLLGEVTGYRTYRKARARLKQAHRAAVDAGMVPHGPVAIMRSVWWRPPIFAALCFYGSFVPSMLINYIR